MFCWVLHHMEGPRFRSLSLRESALFLEGCLVDLPDSKEPIFPLIVISPLFWERREVISLEKVREVTVSWPLEGEQRIRPRRSLCLHFNLKQFWLFGTEVPLAQWYCTDPLGIKSSV